jgi:hypothetical protein
MSGKKILQLVCVTAALATLLFLLHRIGWSTIQMAASRVGLVSAVVLFLLAVAEGVCDALSLRVITGPSLRVGFAVALNSAGALLNLILPWESGEVLKGALLQQSAGPTGAVASMFTWNYIFKLSRPTLSLLAAVFAFFFYRGAPATRLALVILANLLAFSPYLALRLAMRFGATERFIKLIRHIPYLRRRPTHWAEVARSIDAQVRAFWRDRPWAYLQVFLLQSLGRVTGLLNIYLGCRAVGLSYGFEVATLLYATMNVAEYLIAILPARVGVSEGTAFFVFKFYGLDAPMGLVVYSFLRVRNILVHGLLAPFAFLNRNPGGKAGTAITVEAVAATSPKISAADG